MTRTNKPLAQIEVETPGERYPIIVGDGVLSPAQLPSLLVDGLSAQAGTCALLTNTRVGALYGELVQASLRAGGWTPTLIEIPDGEQFKTLETVSGVYDRLIDARLDRSSPILALGGGVVGDLAGFVAATFLRGVPFIQMPTTLLAMVDASIGGKAAVDHPRGKNLIGAFKQPAAILADTVTLATLSEAEWRSGMAEVVKHALIADSRLFELLEQSSTRPGAERASVAEWIERAMRVKVDIVGRDPFERGERGKLNLGHTIGHAVEQVSHYELRHGEAVAIGTVCATELAVQRELCEPTLPARVERLLTAIGLPTRIPRELPTEEILQAMQLDKKRIAGHIRFVLPRGLGDVELVDGISRREILRVVQERRG